MTWRFLFFLKQRRKSNNLSNGCRLLMPFLAVCIFCHSILIFIVTKQIPFYDFQMIHFYHFAFSGADTTVVNRGMGAGVVNIFLHHTQCTEYNSTGRGTLLALTRPLSVQYFGYIY